MQIRPAVSEDAAAISSAIIRALRETNARDYPPHVIEAVVANFSTENVARQIEARRAYVAVIDGVVVGTASLDVRVVRSVYVAPSHQGTGVGSRLMDTIEHLAREQSFDALSVPSSTTAQLFYERRGYVSVREQFHGDEKTIIMRKSLLEIE